ncbi:MAG: SCO family protein [Burkholderiaceae bacterium]|nr:SCO family protein [Burkholderiaceae bacterium]
MQPTRRLLLACAASALLAGPALAAPSLYGIGARWTDDRQTVLTLARFQGKPLLLTMAYSTCRRICTQSMLKLEQLQQEADAAGREIEVVVVSYDPLNDTPQTWADYRKARRLARPNWHFLTGDQAGTRALAAWLGVADFWSLDDHVLHDFRIAIVDARGMLQRQVNWQDLKLRGLW